MKCKDTIMAATRNLVKVYLSSFKTISKNNFWKHELF